MASLNFNSAVMFNKDGEFFYTSDCDDFDLHYGTLIRPFSPSSWRLLIGKKENIYILFPFYWNVGSSFVSNLSCRSDRAFWMTWRLRKYSNLIQRFPAV